MTNTCTLVNKTILLVDSDQNSLDIAFNAIESKYDVLIAKNSTTAIDILLCEKVDLIILENNVDNLNGLEVCSKIISNVEIANIPIIFSSSDSSNKQIQKAFDMGVVDYLHKPFPSKLLQCKIDTILKNNTHKNDCNDLYEYDFLTSIYQRDTFLKNASIKYNDPEDDTLRVVIIDIDDLQIINEKYGFKNGDLVIVNTVDSIKDTICSHAVFGRLDSSKLAILCSLPSDEAVNFSIKYIKDSIDQKILHTLQGDIKWTVSVGVAKQNPQTKDLEDLINRSINNLQTAKDLGKDRIVSN
jgi:diguanylate cyclase (GGDEF)-like protein